MIIKKVEIQSVLTPNLVAIYLAAILLLYLPIKLIMIAVLYFHSLTVQFVFLITILTSCVAYNYAVG